MLRSQQILDLLKNTPQGFLKPDDNLFTVSNENVLKSYKKLGTISSSEYDNISYLSEFSLNDLNEIFCNVLGCSAIFNHVGSYQSHYNTMHRFICSVCKKSVPTEHLLDLHLSENHDAYFMVRMERGESLFKCYFEECTEVFQNSIERKEHCVKQHKLPSNFRFDQVCHKFNKTDVQQPTIMKTSESTVVNKHLNNKSQKTKSFTFGHQKEKTFRLENICQQKNEAGKTLENMNILKEAINSMK